MSTATLTAVRSVNVPVPHSRPSIKPLESEFLGWLDAQAELNADIRAKFAAEGRSFTWRDGVQADFGTFITDMTDLDSLFEGR